mgnify:CR=1 FL=1
MYPSALAARMCPVVELEQIVGFHLRIDLCGRETGMAEQFLDRPQITPVRQEVGRRLAPPARREQDGQLGL